MKIDANKVYGLYEIPEHGTVCKKGRKEYGVNNTITVDGNLNIKNSKEDLLDLVIKLEEKLKDKDDELTYLCEVIDALEEEKKELDSEYEELEEELEEVKKVSESRYDLLLKAVEEIEKNDKLIKELREENRKLTLESFKISMAQASKITDKLHKAIKEYL